MESELNALLAEAQAATAAAGSEPDLEALRIRLLGRKDGRLTLLMRKLPQADPADRPRLGQLANRVKNEITSLLESRQQALGQSAAPSDGPAIDVTLPGRRHWRGSKHLITQTLEEIVGIFVRMGFQEELGPDIEDDWHNFTALNFKPDHPARDAWAGFYLEGGWLLRSHTSPVQIRVMESRPPPVRIVAPGRCYRPDPFDASHSPMFHQVEGLYVEEGVSMADLKGTLDTFCHEFFGPEVKTRLQPSYFPFTEPSAELAASCVICTGDGCPVCKNTGWVELGGCGMVNPNVLRNVGYDPDRYTGYAFGFGVERFAMIKHRIDDIRVFFENDVRFLRQFS